MGAEAAPAADAEDADDDPDRPRPKGSRPLPPATADAACGSLSRPAAANPAANGAGSSAGNRNDQVDAEDEDCDEEEEEEKARNARAVEVVARREAATNHLFPRSYTDISSANLVMPVDSAVMHAMAELKRRKLQLAPRVLMGIYFTICRSGKLSDTINAKLMASWMWGTGRRPPHWRPQLRRSLAAVAEVIASVHRRATLQLVLAKDGVRYTAAPRFLGSLSPMVEGEKLRLLRSVETRIPLTAERLRRARELGGWSVETFDDRHVREVFAGWRKQFEALPSLSNLGRIRPTPIVPVFAPVLLGFPEICKELGPVASLLAANRSRYYKVDGGRIHAFSSDAKVICPFLDPKVTYNAFAANGNERLGRGYRFDHWCEKAGSEIGDTPKKLLAAIAAVAERLELTVVGIGPGNKQYNLAQLQTASPAVLEVVHLRVYVPQGWQQKWTTLFGMELGDLAEDGEKKMAKTRGDLAEVRELVLDQRLQSVAKAIHVDPGNLSRYLRGQASLPETKAAALREHLATALPSGGPQLANAFHEVCKQHPGNLGWALAYCRVLRWPVVPLVPGTRAGYVKNKAYQRMLPSEEEIIEWWTRWPKASIGLILGPLSRVFALDVDSLEAEQTLKDLLGELPAGVRQLSGSWSEDRPFKKHYLFQYPVDVPTGAKSEPLVTGLEFRGRNGLLVLAPSRHKTGAGAYAWEAGHEIWSQSLTAIPAEVADLLRRYAAGTAPSQLAKHPAPIAAAVKPRGSVPAGYAGRKFSARTREFLTGNVPHGERNDRLFAAAREMRDYEMPLADALSLLLPPSKIMGLPDAEATATVRSAYSRTTTPRTK